MWGNMYEWSLNMHLRSSKELESYMEKYNESWTVNGFHGNEGDLYRGRA